jgi:hypothetical protein
MKRKQFFAALFGAGAAAKVKPAPVVCEPKRLGTWRYTPYAGGVPCDCQMCSDLTVDARWIVSDQERAGWRLMCDACHTLFLLHPHPLYPYPLDPYPQRQWVGSVGSNP